MVEFLWVWSWALFSLSASPLNNIIYFFDFKCHLYFEDTNMYYLFFYGLPIWIVFKGKNLLLHWDYKNILPFCLPKGLKFCLSYFSLYYTWNWFLNLRLMSNLFFLLGITSCPSVVYWVFFPFPTELQCPSDCFIGSGRSR